MAKSNLRQRRLDKAVADLVAEFPEILIVVPQILDDNHRLPAKRPPFIYAYAGHDALIAKAAEFVAEDLEPSGGGDDDDDEDGVGA